MSNPRRLFASTVVFFLGFAIAVAAQTPRAMTFVDLLNVPSLGDPQLSPDGTQILYTLSEADWKANRRISHIWRVGADGSGTVKMTNGREGESSPRWSPDGKTIAFITKRGEAQAGQIYLLPNAGGESRQLTNHETAVTNVTWSSDGRTLYFVAADAHTAEEMARDKAKDDVYAFDEDYKQRHLWTVAVATGAESRTTGGDYSILDYALSLDGRRIAARRGPNPLLGSNDRSEVWVMDAAGAHAVQLTNNTVSESNPVPSPDGSQVLFVAGANAKFETYYNDNLFLVPAAGGAARELIPDFPYEVDRAAWAKDGKSIVFSANMGVHSELFQLDLGAATPRQLTDEGSHSIGSWSLVPALGRVLLTVNHRSNPGDIYTMALANGSPERVTHVFDDLARDFRLPRQEQIEWKGADGVTVEGLVYYPLEYQQGQRYPLVVQTHGGPQASDKFGFGGWGSYVQVLTAKGYAVLKPNYRGSTGYGDPFLRDMVGSYFKNAHLDVLTGVDHVIKMGLADPDRLVKMGWSGGGHMTNKVITFTTRFKAASSGAGAADWVSMYAQSDVREYRTPWFGGTPWQKNAPIDVYWEHSPLKYVSNVTTPTIFLVGERDVRVPMPQSVEMYRALKSHGVPTHLYAAPREPHGWTELRHQLFKMNVELDWFEKHATKRPYVWQRAPGDDKNDASTTSTGQ